MAKRALLLVVFAGLSCFGDCLFRDSGDGDSGGCGTSDYDAGPYCEDDACGRECHASGYSTGACVSLGWFSMSARCECYMVESGPDAEDATVEDLPEEDAAETVEPPCADGACEPRCRELGFADGLCDGPVCICREAAAGDADADASDDDVPDTLDVGVPDAPGCGNGAVEPAEECDGDPPRPCLTDCRSLGWNDCLDCRWSDACRTLDADLCNGLDDDCDGATDEDAAFCGCVESWDFETDPAPFAGCADPDCETPCATVVSAAGLSRSGDRALRVTDPGDDPTEFGCRARADRAVGIAGGHAVTFHLWLPAVADWPPCAGFACDLQPVIAPVGTFTRAGWIEKGGFEVVRWTAERWMRFDIEYSCDPAAGTYRYLLDGHGYYSEGSWRYACGDHEPRLQLEVDARGAPAVHLDALCVRPTTTP